jgi:nucleoside 2-deoxyribosyltransferase
MMRIYLAGPDVFLPDPHGRAAALKAICARHGLTGVSPLDEPPEASAEWRALPDAVRIALGNEAHMRASAALIANLTPFRGPSADAGTVFELGYMRALGRPVFGWSNAGADFTTRTLSFLAGAAERVGEAAWRDGEGLAVEAFGCTDNLMIDGAITMSGGSLFVTEVPGPQRWTALAAFERCVVAAAAALRGLDLRSARSARR